MTTTEKRELAFYYPNPMWSYGNWIKNLILFFDGIALLVPEYMRDRPEMLDRPIVAGLKEHGLLEIIEPEAAVDKLAAEKLATAMTEVIASGALDELGADDSAFHELSMSRLGFYGDEGLYQMLVEELKERGLAEESRDNVSIPLHPMVRSLILVLLSQIVRPYGNVINANLNPATDMGNLVRALTELLAVKTEQSCGSVIEFDLNTVTVDLGSMPLDEVLDFRQQNLDEHKHYMLSIRKFVMELSRMPAEEQRAALEIRQTQLSDLANALRNRSRKEWKRPASFALTLAGAAIAAAVEPAAAIVGLLGSLLGSEGQGQIDDGAYSYLFRAQERFGSY